MSTTMMTGTPQEENDGANEGLTSGINSSDVTTEQLQSHETGGNTTAGGGDDGGRLSLSCPRGRGIPPFLTKVYEMVNDPKTDEIISWSSGGTCFTVWDHHIFAKEILPKHFRHDNFSSFIYQLNNYGFNKTCWGQWEYENKWFQQGKEHLLISIKRKNQNPLHVKRKRGTKPLTSSGNLAPEAPLNKLRADQNQMKVLIQGLVKKQENVEKDLVTIKEKIDCLFNHQKTVILMASALKQQMRQHGEHNEAEILEKSNVSPKTTENSEELTDGPDNASQNIMEQKDQVQPEKENTMSCDESGNLASSEAYVPIVDSGKCLLLEDLMEVNENEQQGEVENQATNIVMELEDLMGTPSEWGYIRDFMYHVDFQETKPVILKEGGEGETA